MNFPTSTHKHHWIFSQEELERKRRERYDRSIQDIKRLKGGEGEGEGEEGAFISLAEERHLCSYYERMIAKICSVFRFPRKILAIAIVYFKRLYLTHSIMDFEPWNVMLACIYISCKVENAYISAEELAKGVHQDPRTVEKTVLGCEMSVLQGLKFDLVVHTPYSAFDGFCFDLENFLLDSMGYDHEKAEAFVEEIKKKGYEPIDALLFSDGPLLYAPGLLAYAALEIALNSSSSSKKDVLRGYTSSLLKRTGQSDTSLAKEVASIHNLGAQGAGSLIEERALKGIDRKLKLCRNPVYDPTSEYYKKAAAEKKAREGEGKQTVSLKTSLKRSAMHSIDALGLTSDPDSVDRVDLAQDPKRRKSKGEDEPQEAMK